MKGHYRKFSGWGKSSVPFRNSYEVTPGRLYAGEYPGAKLVFAVEAKLQTLKDFGITDIFDLTTPNEKLKPYKYFLEDYGMRHHSHPIADMRIPSEYEFADQIIQDIDKVIDSDGVAYVHCLGGVGRTGVVIGSYLVRYLRDYSVARRKLSFMWASCPKSKIYPWSPENSLQESYIREYHGYCSERYF